MGAIRRQGSPRELEYLYQDHSVGRSSSCRLVLARSVISGHHANIRWDRGAWMLRDLGSRNGTFHNGSRLTSGAKEWPVTLAEGDEIMFADEDERWIVVDIRPPQAMLIPLEPELEPVVLDEHDVLVLPSDENPCLTIYRGQDAWAIEREGEPAPLDDGELVEVDEHRYRAMITEVLEATEEAAAVMLRSRVEDLDLDIRVSPDEESAMVSVRVGAEVHELPQRAHLYLLAFLARRRLAEPEAPAPDSGWVHVDETCTELSLASAEALGLLVYRCRRAITECGVEDPAAIIDRSRRRQLRIGVPAGQLSVATLS